MVIGNVFEIEHYRHYMAFGIGYCRYCYKNHLVAFPIIIDGYLECSSCHRMGIDIILFWDGHEYAINNPIAVFRYIDIKEKWFPEKKAI